MHPARLIGLIGLLLPALLPRAAANECADARAGLTTWWAANYDLYADDDAGDEERLKAYYASDEYITYSVALTSYWNGLKQCGRDPNLLRTFQSACRKRGGGASGGSSAECGDAAASASYMYLCVVMKQPGAPSHCRGGREER